MTVKPLALVGFNGIMAEGIKGILNRSQFRIRFQCQSLDELHDAYSRCNGNLCGILIDTRGHSTVAICDLTRLRRVGAGTKVVLLVDELTRCEIVSIGRDVDGVILNSSAAAALVKALELILLGQRVYPASIFDAGQFPAPVDSVASSAIESVAIKPTVCPEPTEIRGALQKLSGREMEVTALLCNGAPNKIIARQLGISEATVKVHVKAILRKMQARNRTEAAILMAPMIQAGGASA